MQRLLLILLIILGRSQVVPHFQPYSLEFPDYILHTANINVSNDDVNIDFIENALLTIKPDYMIYRIAIQFEGIKSGHLFIKEWKVPDNAMLFIFSNSKSYTGPYLSDDENKIISGRFISEKLILEYVVPVNNKFIGNFKIYEIYPDYVNSSFEDRKYIKTKYKPRRDRPKIMLTGYWPPTNEMVRHFSQDPELNPDGWKGEDWESSGYDVVSFFPQFNPANCNDCGQGYGNLEVDYQDFSGDFWPIVEQIKPAAIITFSRGFNDMSWELENRVVNRTNWYDDYSPPLLPTPNPPDNTVNNYHVRYTSLPSNEIINAVSNAQLGLEPYLDNTNAGMFLSEYAGYHGVWYKESHEGDSETPCLSGGHIHVGAQLDWEIAREATELSVMALINHIDQFIIILGDCNDDGTVNILDVVALAGAILGDVEFTPLQTESADTDSNGELNILDIIAIVNLILAL